MTDDDYRRRSAAVLQDVEYGPKQVLTISDAEILALDDPQKPRVTPLLGMQNMSQEDRDDAAKQAAQRLFDTRHTEDGTPLGGPDSDDEEPTVRTVLRMRRSWLCLLVVNQETSAGRDFVSVYVRADGRALTEHANADGQHVFTAMKRAIALDSVLRILTPFAHVESADENGVAYPLSTWQEQAMRTLADAKVVSTVISRRQNRAMDQRTEDRLAVYNFDDRTEMLFSETAEKVRIHPVSRATLRARLEEITRPIDVDSGPAT